MSGPPSSERPADPAGAEPAGGEVFLLTDCGSTTTKAILIARRAGRYRLAARGQAPTTVEAPVADVVRGVLAAAGEAGETGGRRLLTAAGALRRPAGPDGGADRFLSTSSAGGGLQMLVLGVVRSMTAASAERVAVGAGAIVSEVVAFDDARPVSELVERLRLLRPDIVLLSGGVDGGSTSQVVQLAELIAVAEPAPRFAEGGRLPVIYAGNREARAQIRQALAEVAAVEVVANLRPTLEREEPGPARARIHGVFMDHVMARAPGTRRLQELCDGPILPTPAACGQAVRRLAEMRGGDVLAVDVGGATTDVFSCLDGELQRTVSANLGLSYSIGHVCQLAGLDAVGRWLPAAPSVDELRNQIKNKMVRPTTLPASPIQLQVEQAVAREALRLALVQHRAAAGELRGARRERDLAAAFSGEATPDRLGDLRGVRLLIGSGGVLAHAPRRQQAAAMLLDGCLPVGATALAVDAVFMLPHLGLLDGVSPEAAREVLAHDALVELGACLAPAGTCGRVGRRLAQVTVEVAGAATRQLDWRWGELRHLELAAGEQAAVSVRPARGVDVGSGPGRPLRTRVAGGVLGLILDGRGRPLAWARTAAARAQQVSRWRRALDLDAEGAA